MTILVKKVFISSKPTFVYLLCPPLCGPFSIQESAAGGLSYKVKNRLRLFNSPAPQSEGTEKHTIFILTLIKKKKSIRVFMILVDFLLDKI